MHRMNHGKGFDRLDTEFRDSIIQNETVFRGHYLTLNRLSIRFPDMKTGEREIVRIPDAVAVLPIDEQGYVHLVRQNRHAVQRILLEVPAGLLEAHESLEDAVRRECEEETGYRPGRLHRLVSYAQAEGYSTGFITLFFSDDLRYTGRISPDESEYLENVTLTFDELFEKVRSNAIIDSKTILCTLLSRPLVK